MTQFCWMFLSAVFSSFVHDWNAHLHSKKVVFFFFGLTIEKEVIKEIPS